GSSQPDHRHTELDDAASAMTTTVQDLTRQAVDLEQERPETPQQLSAMRDWFRRTLRGLAETGPKQGTVSKDAPAQILSMQSELDPGDRTLGELLRSLELVDNQTLSALWLEARRQRRSLRQVLLASGKLTVYQMALIEAGNVDNLCIGPLGVIDR